jgi:hypothetical protein
MKTTETRYEVSLLLLTALSMMASPVSRNVDAAESVSTPPPAAEPRATNSNGAGSDRRGSSHGLANNVPAGAPGYSAISEVVKLSQSGVEDPVILSFVASSTSVYPPSADDIIYLHQNGISVPVITALIQRGHVLRSQAIQAARQAEIASAVPTPPAAVNPMPAPAYDYPVSASYPVSAYSYPSYPLVSYPAYNYAYSYPYSYWDYGYRYPYSSSLWLFNSYGRLHRDYDRYGRFGGHFGGYQRPFVSRGSSFNRPIAFHNAGPWTSIPGHRFAGRPSAGRPAMGRPSMGGSSMGRPSAGRHRG